MRALVITALAVSLVFVACSDEAGPGSKAAVEGPGADASDGGADASVFDSGTELRVPVPDSGRVYVKLAPPSIVTPAGDPKASREWDLAFEGFDVFTNSGVSGGGSARSNWAWASAACALTSTSSRANRILPDFTNRDNRTSAPIPSSAISFQLSASRITHYAFRWLLTKAAPPATSPNAPRTNPRIPNVWL